MAMPRLTRSSLLSLVIVLMCALTAFGDDPRTLREPHNPTTFQGLRVRSNIAVPVPGVWGTELVSMGPALFQEIPRCQFISTLAGDQYPSPWGGPAFVANESRTYSVIGLLQNGTLKALSSCLSPTTAK